MIFCDSFLDVRSDYKRLCEESDEKSSEIKAFVDQLSDKDEETERLQQQIVMYKQELSELQTTHR